MSEIMNDGRGLLYRTSFPNDGRVVWDRDYNHNMATRLVGGRVRSLTYLRRYITLNGVCDDVNDSIRQLPTLIHQVSRLIIALRANEHFL